MQLIGEGVACLDLGFPMRHSHSAREVCDLSDLDGSGKLVTSGIGRIGPGFSLDRDA